MVIDMTLLLLISGVCSIVFAKIKMPPILGYLTAGIILGPTMFPELWVEGNTVALLSGIGIVLLMFYIGLETDMAKLKVNGSKLVFIVLLQMPIVVAIGYFTGIVLGMNFVQSIFLGAIISGTSTAVVVGVLNETKHIDAETAKTIVTITIFEDVGQVIIMTMAAPLLAGDSPALGSTVYMIMGLILFIGLTIVLGMATVPRVLDYIGKKYSPEILLIISVGLCFAMAAVSTALGLSIAIGAFIMGMLISLSHYSHTIANKVEPVKELFMAVFFISIGLQVSPWLIVQNIGLAVIIAIVFIVSKIGSVWLGCFLTNMTAQKSLLIATSLVAMGEFAFIIAKLALDAGIVAQDFYSAVIGAALISMVVMPLITKVQPQTFNFLEKHTPYRIRCALSRINHVRDTASSQMGTSSREKATIKRSLTLIFVDSMVIVLIMLVFNTFSMVQAPFADAASQLRLLPQELLLLLLIVVISPVIQNIHSQVKSIAKALTSLTMEAPRYKVYNERYIYSIFANIGNAAMFIGLLALIIPFIPENTMIGPVGLGIVLISALVIIFLAWNTLRRTYERFHCIIAYKKDDEADGIIEDAQSHEGPEEG